MDVRILKGHIRDYQLVPKMEDYPELSREGERDLRFPLQVKLSLETLPMKMTWELISVDEPLLQQMEEAALCQITHLARVTSRAESVWECAYTSDFSPFFGQVPELAGVYAASGLNSSEATTGPIIMDHLAQLIQDKELTLDPLNYPIENYVKRVKSE